MSREGDSGSGDELWLSLSSLPSLASPPPLKLRIWIKWPSHPPSIWDFQGSLGFLGLQLYPARSGLKSVLGPQLQSLVWAEVRVLSTWHSALWTLLGGPAVFSSSTCCCSYSGEKNASPCTGLIFAAESLHSWLSLCLFSTIPPYPKLALRLSVDQYPWAEKWCWTGFHVLLCTHSLSSCMSYMFALKTKSFIFNCMQTVYVEEFVFECSVHGGQKVVLDPLSRSYRWLWAPRNMGVGSWTLEELSSGRAGSTLYHCSISPVLLLCLMLIFIFYFCTLTPFTNILIGV